MRRPGVRRFAWTLASLVALLMVVGMSSAGADDAEPSPEPETEEVTDVRGQPTYELSGRILTREHADGRLEFCFEPTGLDVVCPDARFVDPTRVRRDRWIRGSEIEWTVPVDPEHVVYPAPPRPDDGSCTTDFERMFAATWKVETTKWLGTAFYIGDGRFVTAHHVIDGVPPFLTLTHGDRAVAAAVLGSDPEHDVALLEVFDRTEITDVPAVAFRNPTIDDIGDPVYLVGYPSAGALTAATGIVTRVWEDEILTSSSSKGGNSGGPMFDACSDVLGVLWAGSSASNFSHSGEALSSALTAMSKRRPPVPANVPEVLTFDGLMVWHYGPEPPVGVDCSGTEGEWWVGLAGQPHQINGTLGISSPDRCGHGPTIVLAFERPPHEPSSDGSGICIERHGVDGRPLVRSVLHQSSETIGALRLISLEAPHRCDARYTHSLRVEFAEPQRPRGMVVHLIDRKGRWLRQARGVSVDDPTHPGDWANTRYAVAIVYWDVATQFEPVRMHIALSGRSWNVNLHLPSSDRPVVAESARIAVRRDARTSEVEVCVEVELGTRVCPTRAVASGHVRSAGGWRRSGLIEWRAAVSSEALARIRGGTAGCAVTEALGGLAWQMTALGENGTAVYVGNDQFITSDRLFSDQTPWGVAARGDTALPVVRVASDLRNGLALVEIVGGPTTTGRRDAAVFARSTGEFEGNSPVLVAYPWGDADRFALTRLDVREVTERLIRHDGWGWDRAGAPLVDPCTAEVIGLSTGRSEALRAETVKAMLEELRARRTMPVISNRGPSLHGSIALLPHPVYLGTEQPDFGGWICNVRPSTRYEVVYAVYLVSDSSPHITGVADGKRAWFSRCGWTDKIFILEYRSDETPSAVCAAPWEPRSPRSTLALELFTPPGAELLQATELERLPCPGMPSDRKWASTHFVRMRFADTPDVDDLVVWLEDETGKRFHSVGSSGDVDPDVRAWRYDLGDAEPVRLVATTWENADSWEAPETVETGESEVGCVEDPGPNGDGLITATLHESQAAFGSVKLMTYGAPVRCPWFHTHGVIVRFAEPVPKSTKLDASLIGVDGRVVAGDWPGWSGRGHVGDPRYTEFHQHWEVPEDFEPIAVELRIGSSRWVVVIGTAPTG